MQTLIHLINEQKLLYIYPFSNFPLETDLRLLVLSHGKSVLPVSADLALMSD